MKVYCSQSIRKKDGLIVEVSRNSTHLSIVATVHHEVVPGVILSKVRTPTFTTNGIRGCDEDAAQMIILDGSEEKICGLPAVEEKFERMKKEVIWTALRAARKSLAGFEKVLRERKEVQG